MPGPPPQPLLYRCPVSSLAVSLFPPLRGMLWCVLYRGEQKINSYSYKAKGSEGSWAASCRGGV